MQLNDNSNLNSRKSFWLAIFVAVPLVAISVYFAYRKPADLPEGQDASAVIERQRTMTVGGVQRPASDFAEANKAKTESASEREYEVDPATQLIFGTVPTQKPDANPMVASAHEALTTGKHPERLSPLVQPKAFDLASFKTNPASYLEVHEPGRVFQSAQPGPGVPVLIPEGSKAHVLRQGETIRLKVKTQPEMPATFTSFDIGTFENGLTSISVAADEKGIAEAAYFAAPGKIGEVNILAASPVAAEQVKFDVWILPPNSK